jgi:hypothetical protein
VSCTVARLAKKVFSAKSLCPFDSSRNKRNI